MRVTLIGGPRHGDEVDVPYPMPPAIYVPDPKALDVMMSRGEIPDGPVLNTLLYIRHKNDYVYLTGEKPDA